MKKIKGCPLLWGIVVAGIGLSLLGWLGAEGIYKDYMGKWPQVPGVVAVFQGLADEQYPWEVFAASGEDELATLAVPATEMEQVAELSTESVSEDETETEAQEPESYNFTRVDESYFDDAVFIGDSRTVGLHDYSGWDNTTYYASIGMNVFKLFTDPVVEEEGEKITIEEALTRHQFKKVYLMVGINEMGYGGVDQFMAKYEEAVQHLRELQPDAIIFVQGIMYVKQEKSETDPIFNNPGIKERNERIAELANNQNIFYIDVNEVVADETGNLNPDYTYDEIHLLGKHYPIWMEFLMDHGIVKE